MEGAGAGFGMERETICRKYSEVGLEEYVRESPSAARLDTRNGKLLEGHRKLSFMAGLSPGSFGFTLCRHLSRNGLDPVGRPPSPPLAGLFPW